MYAYVLFFVYVKLYIVTFVTQSLITLNIHLYSVFFFNHICWKNSGKQCNTFTGNTCNFIIFKPILTTSYASQLDSVTLVTSLNE